MSKNKAFMFSMGLIAGVVGGIVAGVLYAPKSGEESRKELKDAACDLYENTLHKLRKLKTSSRVCWFDEIQIRKTIQKIEQFRKI